MTLTLKEVVGYFIVLGMFALWFYVFLKSGPSEKFRKWLMEPAKCLSCGGTEFEPLLTLEQILLDRDPWYGFRFDGIGGGNLSFPPLSLRRCKKCKEVQ